MDEQQALDALKGAWRGEFVDEALEAIEVDRLIVPENDGDPWEVGYLQAVDEIRDVLDKLR